jgi:hypothetical protein
MHSALNGARPKTKPDTLRPEADQEEPATPKRKLSIILSATPKDPKLPVVRFIARKIKT